MDEKCNVLLHLFENIINLVSLFFSDSATLRTLAMTLSFKLFVHCFGEIKKEDGEEKLGQKTSDSSLLWGFFKSLGCQG